MICPAGCDDRLVIAERSGIEIDYSPTCRGVWLDRGELDKVIDRDRDRPSGRDTQNDQRPRKKKRGGSSMTSSSSEDPRQHHHPGRGST